MLVRCYVKYPLLLSDDNKTNFLETLLKNPHLKNITKIRPAGADLFLADRETDRQTDRRMDGRTDGRTNGRADITKLIVASRNIAYAPNNTELHPRRPEPYVMSSLTVFIFLSNI
jgi:hypothetical protein